MPKPTDKARAPRKQFLWMVGLWAGGVGAVLMVAVVIRLVMTALGMKSH